MRTAVDQSPSRNVGQITNDSVHQHRINNTSGTGWWDSHTQQGFLVARIKIEQKEGQDKKSP